MKCPSCLNQIDHARKVVVSTVYLIPKGQTMSRTQELTEVYCPECCFPLTNHLKRIQEGYQELENAHE